MGSKVEYVSVVPQPTSDNSGKGAPDSHCSSASWETYLVRGRTGMKPDMEVIVAGAGFSWS